MPNFVTPAGVVLAAVQVWVPRALRHRRKANRPAEILKAHHATKSRWSKPSTEYGSRQQPPPIRDPLTQHVEHIPTKREIIRVIPRPLKPGLQPSLIRRNVPNSRQPIVRPEHHQLERRPINQRPTMHSHSGRPPTQNADAPHADGAAHATHPTQTQARYPDAPSQTPCKPGPRVHTTATTPQPATHQDRTTASSGGGATVNGGLRCLAITAPLRSPKLSKLAVRHGGPVQRHRPRAAARACRCPGRKPDSSPSSGNANESTSRRNNKR